MKTASTLILASLVVTSACSNRELSKRPSAQTGSNNASGERPGESDPVVEVPGPTETEPNIPGEPNVFPALPLALPLNLKLLSLNVWTGGPADIARDIKQTGADITCVQEIVPSEASSAAASLGAEWNAVHTGSPDATTGYAILSRLPLIKRLGETSSGRGGIGAIYQLNSGVRAAIFCHHANAYPYGPYALGKEGKTVAQVVELERYHRGSQMEELLSFTKKSLGGVDTVFLVGDFNAPSHLDYSPPMPWPVSTMVHAAGFQDSYAELHPNNPKKSACQFSQNDPGITWARLAEEEHNNCFDRIDFIYYSSPVAKAKESKTFDLGSSDHRAVLSTFEILDKSFAAKASLPVPSNARNDVARRPVLSWAKAENAAEYNLFIGKNSDLKVKGLSLKDNYFAADLLEAEENYYWRVDVIDTLGATRVGDVWSFKTSKNLAVSTDKKTYAPGEKVAVTFDGGQAKSDWIGILSQGAPKASSWKYLNDQQNLPAQVIGKGQVVLSAPSVRGSYYVRALLNDSYSDVDEIIITVP